LSRIYYQQLKGASKKVLLLREPAIFPPLLPQAQNRPKIAVKDAFWPENAKSAIHNTQYNLPFHRRGNPMWLPEYAL